MEGLAIAVIVIVVIAIIAFLGFKLYSDIKLKGLRQTAIDLIVKAEEAFEKGMNDEKFNSVLEGILAVIPSYLKFFINEDTIKSFIQNVFDSIKAALDVQAKLPENTENSNE